MKRGKFSLSNFKLFSCNMGELIPCGMFEVLPGDTIQQATSMLVRAAPLLSPVMHPVTVRIHHWYIPYRLIWEDFEDFITGGPDGMDASVYPTRANVGGVAVGGVDDYMGIPTGVTNLAYSALPNRAYQTIWNEWYRDQDLETAIAVQTASGADTTSNVLQSCDWEKDYFTSARPWEQKGPSITVPIGDSAPVVYSHENTNPWLSRTAATGALNATASEISSSAAGQLEITVGNVDQQFDPAGNLVADLSSASAVSVIALREAMALQRYEEARARFGSRYTEYLRYLGVTSSDARLQRPEYLGGGKQTIQFSEVLTTGTFGTEPVGSLKGHGIGSMRSNRYRRFFEEHGLVMSLMSVRPKTMYVQGLPRMWNRRSKEDFWQQELQHVGQQEVLNKEVYGAHTTKDGVFGYQDRYDEYRRVESTIGGEFRNSTLDFWHLARVFTSDPALNAAFVKCTPTERIFAASTNHVLYNMANHSIQARRLVAQTGRSFIF